MNDIKGYDDLSIHCPFCNQSISSLKQYIQPDVFTCPICGTKDYEWNVTLNCINCGFGYRIFECPHCKEDLDTFRLTMGFDPEYKDYIRIEKYWGPLVRYNISELNCYFSPSVEIDEDKKVEIIDLISNVFFIFPGTEKKINSLGIYNLQRDSSIKTKFWVSANLYVHGQFKFEIGHIAISLSPSMQIIFQKVVDVSRNFLDFYNIEWGVNMGIREELEKLKGKKCHYDGSKYELVVRKDSATEIIDVEENCIVIKHLIFEHVDKIPFYAIFSIDRQDKFKSL